jgi:hypothetical protein
MGQAKQRKAEIEALKQAVADIMPVKLYNTDELYRRDKTLGFRSIVYPELNQREDSAICNILFYPAGSNTPAFKKMTNAGAVYMSWLETDNDRENEYLFEISRKGEDNGILVQAAVVSKTPLNARQRETFTQKILYSLPDDIRHQFKGEIHSWIQDIKEVKMFDGAGTKVGWV